jgi:hypothetical protein
MGLSGGEELVDWLPRHQYSLRAINEKSLEMVRCFSSLGREEEEKRMGQLKKELREVYDVLNTSDLEKARSSLSLLWERKANQCYNELSIERMQDC